MLRWRFEALKLRCVVIDRELLLEQHKVPFEPTPKHMKKIVEERFGDYTKEQPNIDLDAVLNSKEVEKKSLQNEATNASTNGSQPGPMDIVINRIRQNPIRIKPFAEIEANVASVSNQIENRVPTLNMDSVKKEPVDDELDENVEIKPDVSTILGNMNDSSSFTTPFAIHTAIKQENKENFSAPNTVNENCLATEWATLNPRTPQPKFRTLNLSTQRKQELKEFTQEVAKSGTTVNLNESNAEHIKLEIPTPPTRIKQKPRKMNFTVNRIICKRSE